MERERRAEIMGKADKQYSKILSGEERGTSGLLKSDSGKNRQERVSGR